MKKAFITILILLLVLPAQAQTGSVTAEAISQANLRATTDLAADKVGEISAGTQYPVVGRSEFYPWVLLGDPVSLQPIGWVFQDILTIRGNLASVALSSLVITGSSGLTTPTLPAPVATSLTSSPLVTPQALPTGTQLPDQPTAAPVYAVSGTVRNEINVRYGPSADYDRLGVAVAGDVFEVTAYHTQYPWVQVRYENSPNGKAWIAQDLLDITGNIYALPAISDPVLQLPTLTPTPSVVTSTDTFGDAAATPDPAFVALGNSLYTLMLTRGFDLETSKFAAFFLMDLQTGQTIAVGDQIDFSGTSVMKVAILARLYETLLVPPTEQLATDIANTMICSENNATNRLLSAIGNGDDFTGADEVTSMFQALGLTHSFIISPYVADPNRPPVATRPMVQPVTGLDQTKANPDFTNQLSVSDMGHLLGDIYECAYKESGPLLEDMNGAFEPRECRQMLHVMSNNTVDALLKSGVPDDIRVAHKHGWIEDTHSNAAVIFTPGGDYVMVMAAYAPSFLNFQESLPLIAESSRLVYNYYNPTAPLDAIRDGFIPATESCNYTGSQLVKDLRQPVWDQ